MDFAARKRLFEKDAPLTKTADEVKADLKLMQDYIRVEGLLRRKNTNKPK